jgi:formamidopyrimidine-DNA glycosylase
VAEGHVVRYNAERFHAALAGKPVVRAFWRSRRVPVPPQRIVGRRVARVDFAGKNHFFHLDDGSFFRVHLMMFGSTQLGPPHAPLRKPEPRVRFLLEVPDARVVAFSAPIVEWHPPGTRLALLDALGPDSLKEPFDGRAFAQRLRVAPHATVAEALLDPGVVAGVGNVYKSEALWQAGVDPRRAPGGLTEAEAARLAQLVPEVMLEAYAALKLHADMRLHRRVYRRSGQPCLRCATTLQYAAVGGRRTFWCPSCQPSTPQARPPARSTATPPLPPRAPMAAAVPVETGATVPAAARRPGRDPRAAPPAALPPAGPGGGAAGRGRASPGIPRRPRRRRSSPRRGARRG